MAVPCLGQPFPLPFMGRTADKLPPLDSSHGTPVGIKDIMDTVDMPTTLGSPIYARRQPDWDAACVAALRAAGGSSSGLAAAVADCVVPLALGSQTAASVTRPAAFCGLVWRACERLIATRKGEGST